MTICSGPMYNGSTFVDGLAWLAQDIKFNFQANSMGSSFSYRDVPGSFSSFNILWSMAFTLTGGRLSSSSLFFSFLSHAVVSFTLVTSKISDVKLAPSLKTGAGALAPPSFDLAATQLPGMWQSNGVTTADAWVGGGTGRGTGAGGGTGQGGLVRPSGVLTGWGSAWRDGGGGKHSHPFPENGAKATSWWCCANTGCKLALAASLLVFRSSSILYSTWLGSSVMLGLPIVL